MISFALACSKGHRFDAWFRGGSDYESQRAAGLLSCPVCGDGSIGKALMAPRVSTARSKAKAAQEVHQAMQAARATLAADSGEAGGGKPLATLPGRLEDAPAPVKAYVEAVRKLRREIEAGTEDVGARFAEEARRMHLGEAEERPIRGEASLEEAAALDEEGIDVFLIPALPEDGH